MQVPTTKRQYYDTTKKVSSLAAYSGAIREGAEAWGKLFDGQQKANMESLQIDVENEVKAEFARKSPEYDNNPDNPEFKQYMDDFRKQKYSEAREQVNPFYRGQFDALTRENDKRYNSAFDGWKIQQRQANASANVKKISQSMIDEAYLAGQTGDFEDAKAQYNKKVETIRNISTTTLGARATEQGIEDLDKKYKEALLSGMLESRPVELAAMLSGKHNIDDPQLVSKYKKMATDRIKKLNQDKIDNEILTNANIQGGLLQQSAQGNLSLQEIQTQMPDNASDEYKELIYKINGYSKEGTKNVSPTEKALAYQELNDTFVALVSNPETTVADFQKLQNKVYSDMAAGKITVSQGNDFLNNMAIPTMNAWKGLVKQYGGNPFFSKAYGYDKLDDWITDSVLGKEPKEHEYKNRKSEYKSIMNGRANRKSDIYAQYNEALNEVAKQHGYHSPADILAQNKKTQTELYNEAVAIVQKTYAENKFPSLRDSKANPTYVLSGGSLTQVANNPEDKGAGTQLKESRVVNTAYDPEKGIYGVQFADGTIKEVSYEEYKKYGGSK
jgi:hypothetical protein